MEAIAIAADVKGSRRRMDREAWSERLRFVLREVNRKHRGDLLGGFDVSKGVDEFSGVLRPEARGGAILWSLVASLHPVPVRVSLALGELDVVPRRGRVLPSARLFDGPAFHQAARGLEAAHVSGRLLALAPPRPGVAAFEHVANLLYATVLGWTPRQLALFESYLERRSQTAVARIHGISQPTVSQALTRIHAKLVAESVVFVQEHPLWREDA